MYHNAVSQCFTLKDYYDIFVCNAHIYNRDGSISLHICGLYKMCDEVDQTRVLPIPQNFFVKLFFSDNDT